jgi:two-component system copper resistance phosphate regulon response regulator CusR
MTTEVQTARILVIDDDPKIREVLQDGLTQMGMEIETAADGLSGLERLQAGSFDMILLDVMLPDIQGWDLLTRLRQLGIHTPVILVTARDAVDERIKGLLLGGDDYVVKPFVFNELVARIQAVLRRKHQNMEWRVGDLVLDHLQGRVRRGRSELDLTRVELGLLRRLMERRGHVVSREDLLKSVWGIDFNPGTNLVEVHIRRLRHKVDRPFGRPLIHTMRGQGYVIEDRG